MIPKRKTNSGNGIAPICPYCDKTSTYYASSEVVYRKDYGPIWACLPCKAWVGCHPGGKRNVPLGRLANAELRGWKQKTHAVLDPLWKIRRTVTSDKWSRAQAYKWLAEQLGITRDECHVGEFDVDLCRRAFAICTPVLENLKLKMCAGAEITVKPRTPKELAETVW